MKTASNPTLSTNILRKPTRRARTPQTSTRHPMPSNNHNDNSSPPNPNNNTSLWSPDDILAIAQAVKHANHLDPSTLFGGSDAQLPDTLNHKSREQVNAIVQQLQLPFDQSIVPFAPDNTLSNYIAVLASEISFLNNQRDQRDAALDVLNKARSERKQVEHNRQRLIAESKALTKQVQDEHAKRTRALESKAEDESTLESKKRELEEQRRHYDLLRHNLEQAKLAELDLRRRLDRMRLKVAAMRGEMIIPTVDKLSARHIPKWLGEFDDSLISGASDPKDGKDSDSTPKADAKKSAVEMEAIVTTEDIESPAHSAKDDLELDDSNEEIEFRLLKNRLVMCEMEAEEWKQCVESERQKVRMILRSKARLEEDLARQKHGGGNKASGSGSGRGVGKSGSGNAKATAKLRAAIRASLPQVPDSGARKPIRKSRKGRPRRALVPELA